MTILRLDYQRSMKPLPVAGVILLLVAIAALVLTGAYYYQLAMEMTGWEASLAKLERAAGLGADGKRSGARETREVAQEIKHANKVLSQLSLPWEGMFQAVESSADGEVTLLGMEPDIEKHIVSISCEAKNIAAMLNYVRRLEQRSEFGSVFLQNHRIQEHDPEKPVRFSLSAAWRVAP